MPRTLDELLSADSAWPLLLNLFARSPHDVRVAEASLDARTASLLAVQVTTRSVLGAMAWNCGVVAIDHGWVRLLGAGIGTIGGVHAERLNDVEQARTFEGVVVAHDVLGGRFAIHGGGLDEVPLGEVVYWAPDTLTWTATGLGHSALVEFLLSERLAEFYADLRWSGWQSDSEAVALDHGLSAYPFAWTSEGRGANVSRKAVPMSELVEFSEHAAGRLRGRADKDPLTIELT